MPKRRKTDSAAAQNKTRGLRNSVRIVGGEWRGRRIQFPPATDLRPTPDRVRETLFNWLQGGIAGARCLDLFAGSGALGIEALSRGALSALFVERERSVAVALRASLAALKDTRGTVVERDAHAFLEGPAQRFDVVFLDPPYAQGALGELCTLLESREWLAPGAWIYLEFAASVQPPALPGGWLRWRETRAGAVQGLLARRGSGAEQAVGET